MNPEPVECTGSIYPEGEAMFRRFLPAVFVLVFTLSACDLHISLPVTQPTGPTTTDEITAPLPAASAQPAVVNVAFGAGTLKLHSGAAASSLVSGTATYNISDFKPTVTVDAASVRIEQGNWHLSGIPDLSKVKNEWDLSLANLPLDLTIDGGAYHAEYDFGGLALTDLTISDGAADVTAKFSSPNLAQMSLLSYSTGASNVSLTGLGNANFASLEFDSGAGNYTLDFSGKLKRNGSVHIGTGVSNLTLVIPVAVPVQITVKGAASNVSSGSGWTRNGNVYTQVGTGPELTFVIEIGAGNITLTR
jgi:hypothetical protein